MWLLIAEAFIALGMLVFIVWWTMSSRRRDSPPPAQTAAETVDAAKAAIQESTQDATQAGSTKPVDGPLV